MINKVKFFLVYGINGIVFLFFILIFYFIFSPIGKILSFSKIFLLSAIIYILLFLSLMNHFRHLEKKLSLNTKVIAIVILVPIFFVFFLIIKQNLNAVGDITFTCSMYHPEKNFDIWWEKNKFKYNNITKDEFKKFPFPNGVMKLGSNLVKVKPEEVKVGDVIVFQAPYLDIYASHRVIKKWKENDTYFFQTLGDNNDIPEIVNGSYLNGKLIEVKLLSFFERDKCEEQGDFLYCKNKKKDLCNIKDKEIENCCPINSSVERSRCFYDYAVEQNTPSLCCSVGEEYKDMCYEEFALKTKEIKFCELIDKTKSKYKDCLFMLALETKNPSLCNRLKIFSFSVGCYGSLINTHLCRSMLSDIDYCYKTVAETISDLQICDEILDKSRKNECRVNIATVK